MIFKPYWNSSVEENSKKLWLPTKEGINSLPSSAIRNTWFSSAISTYTSVSSTSFTASETKIVRSRKVRVYLDANQKQIFAQWAGISRKCFNDSINYLKQEGTKAIKFLVKKKVIDELPEWANSTPYQVKATAVFDACKAISNAKQKFRKEGKFQEVKFRSKRNPNQSIGIPKSAVKRNGVYVTLLGKIKFSEYVKEVKYDCRLVRESGRFYLVIPEDKNISTPDNQRNGIVALDPGIRTFQTFYSEQLVGEVGSKDIGRINRLCYHLDRLMSKISQTKGKRKWRMRRAASRLRFRIKNLISEIHNKLALFLCKTFDYVVIPKFEVQQMASKLNSSVARAMYTWSHYRFRMHLKSKCQQYSVAYIEQCEAYTSKTCSNCGKLHNIGNKKTLSCTCGCIIDRDINGARGIFLRALEDNPSLRLSS